MTKTVRVGVLASGNGSNLQALIDADLGPARVEVVIVNRPHARALERAKAAGIEGVMVDHRSFADRRDFDAELVRALHHRNVEWVVLAGFMRLLTDVMLAAFPSRIVNIHPSLLPAFPGMDAPAQALASGVKLAGCTVHLVDAGMDSGAVLAQAAVPVLPEDTVERLAGRILQQEHRLLPGVVRALAEGRLVGDVSGPAHLREARAAGTSISNPRLEPVP